MRERLQKTWDDRKNYYDQMFDLQIFMRDAEQLNSISTSQEVGGQQTVHLFHHQTVTALGYRRCRKLRTILFRVWNYEKSLSLSFSLSLSLSLSETRSLSEYSFSCLTCCHQELCHSNYTWFRHLPWLGLGLGPCCCSDVCDADQTSVRSLTPKHIISLPSFL